MTLRTAGAWTLYGLGEAAWWLECKFFGHLCLERRSGRPWINLSIYPIYNRLMLWSDTVQGPNGNGPWSEITGEDGETARPEEG